MCGSFTCSKNTLVGLNVIYILVSFLMMGVAVHSKVSGILTSLPIVGGITASGVFLLFISVVGLIGAMKHHQVMLFFYMVVLFFIFIIQFSCSCAALTMSNSPEDQKNIIHYGWNHSNVEIIKKAELKFDCCGLGLSYDNTPYEDPTAADHQWTLNHTVFNDPKYKDTKDCYPTVTPNGTEFKKSCRTCYTRVQNQISGAFKAAGGLGLFFSFPELIGALVACRYRNLMDPFISAALPS